MNKNLSITIMMPALNEEGNIKSAVEDLINVFHNTSYDWEIVLIDDGSNDATYEIVDEIAKAEPKVKVIHHEQPLGIGYCFREGIRESTKKVITWLPADGENDPRELLKYLPLIEHVDIVIPFVINKKVRSLLRRILSSIYLTIINTTFGTNFNYTNGNIIYRKAVFDAVRPRSNGFLVHAECLVKAIRSGFIFAEVPVTIARRREGDSSAMLFTAFCKVVKEYFSLLVSYYILREGKVKRELRNF